MVILLAGFFCLQDAQKARKSAEPWVSPVVTPEEVAALSWVRENTAERTVFVSDIFGGEQLMGGALREGTEGGDWAIVPNVVQRMADSDEMLGAGSAERAWQLARQYNASYVWAPNRQVFAGFSWKDVGREKFRDSEYFELVYNKNGMEIYKVRG